MTILSAKVRVFLSGNDSSRSFIKNFIFVSISTHATKSLENVWYKNDITIVAMDPVAHTEKNINSGMNATTMFGENFLATHHTALACNQEQSTFHANLGPYR